ncbi:hypothetical protein [Domibacillus aminovorans]|uniref:Uncharacterized protein n=1 Tax=Domibacillus aminovorans TaxID=29332 RepID=A0A177L508_9BACI|nr:hypothetical protein [Domibacillus aminovorans]OAH60435.1 hypothetical protein AWH49_16365 [Domibacillus aminovorans]
MKEDLEFIRDIMLDKSEELNDLIVSGGRLSPKVELAFIMGIQGLLNQSIQKKDKEERQHTSVVKKSEYETISSIANK